MDLTGVLLRAGARRPHVLVATMPGGTGVRLAVEDQLRRRGWPAAGTPADADVLFVAGDIRAVAAITTRALDETWRAMPAPRARADAGTAGDVAATLDAAGRQLADPVGQRQQAWQEVDEGGGDRRPDEGGMDMPAGLSMAERGTDRDGLTLDQLHLTFGPILPDWPAGLVLRLSVQGDVIQLVDIDTAHRTAAAPGSFWTEPWKWAAAGEPVTTGQAARRRVAAHLDSLGRLLAVAGWPDAASTARRLRDEVLSSAVPTGLPYAVTRFARRIGGSRTLRWLTGGLGVLAADDAVAAGVVGPALRAAGDVPDRYRRWCADLVELGAMLDDVSPLDPTLVGPPRGPSIGGRAPSAALLAVLPSMLTGAELAAARLILASVDPDLDDVGTLSVVGHGH